ncbi:MAG: hypothetical protein EPN25_08065 [Nitrospirae bacterium]|nr:MAG: hypothetical protein EPN25_08065 [Nitrospirota bacterium]
MNSLSDILTSEENSSKGWKVLALAIVIIYGATFFDLITSKQAFMNDATVWYGSFHYYLEHMKQGIFPYWDPYALMGTYFYPNISGYGLLDPACLVFTALSKLFHVLPYTLFTFFRLYRIFVFTTGAYFLYRYVSNNRLASIAASGILLFTVTLQNTGQPMMDYCFTIPFALYFMLLLLDNITNRRRYLYLSGLTLITGITMNVFIPSLYLFTMFFFLTALFVFRRYDLMHIITSLRSRKMILHLLLCAVLVIMMSAPPFSVYLFDTAKDGELFAVAKLVDSNNFRFKQMMATEFGGDLFFDKLRKDSGTFLSYGSALNLLYPDLEGLRYRTGSDNPPVVPLYIGIIPLILFLFGIFYGRSSLTAPFLLLMVFVVLGSFSFTDVYSTFNPVQKALNLMFPPLRMLDTRINFASLISFFMCLFFCLGLSALMRHQSTPTMVPRNRLRTVLFLCLIPIAAKTIMTGYYAGTPLFLSRYDAAVLAIPIAVIAALLLVRYRLIRPGVAVGIILLISFVDLAAPCITKISQLRPTATMYRFLSLSGEEREQLLHDSERVFDGFELYRAPFVPIGLIPVAAFNELLAKTRGAFISNVLGHTFTTKRYYDMFSLLLPEQQMLINGVLHPVVRFFPLDQTIKATDRRELLENIRTSGFRSFETYMFIEENGKAAYDPPADFRLSDLEDVLWFNDDRITTVYNDYLPYLAVLRRNIARVLSNEDVTLRVSGFSINEIALSVENRVGGYLQYTDGWSKYWRAYDGETELPVLISNYNSKAVLLSPGKHDVRFVFDPRHYKIALLLFYAGLFITVVLAIYTVRQTKRTDHSPVPAD